MECVVTLMEAANKRPSAYSSPIEISRLLSALVCNLIGYIGIKLVTFRIVVGNIIVLVVDRAKGVDLRRNLNVYHLLLNL